jgi:hypothetical protein
LKKSAWMLVALTTVLVVSFTTIANSEAVAANTDYNIDRVDHAVSVLSNGFVLVNDTITTSAPASGSFLIGFPYKYGLQTLHCIAYEVSDRSFVFPVTLNVPLDNRVGFYGVRVDLPDGAPQVFTVESVLSNSLVTQDSLNGTVFTLDFPAYPSLTKSVALCNGLVNLPSGAEYIEGTVAAFNYTTNDLAAYSYDTSTLTFGLGEDKMQLFEIKQLSREISISAFGDLAVSDSYYITNDAQNDAVSVDVILPPNSTVPTAEDQFGRSAQILLIDSPPYRYGVTLTLPAGPGKSSKFTVVYGLDKNAYSEPQNEANKFAYEITQFKEITYYVDEVSVVVSLPEGARLLSSPVAGFYGVDKGMFADSMTIQKQNVISLDSFPVEIDYEYNPLWTAFRPTLWVWSIALVGCTIFLISRRPRAPAKVALPSGVARLRPENLKSFVDSYEEKMRILSEIDALEARVQKGRIPRRRYKVQKKTLEMRLATLSRDMGELKENMRASGGHYADLMHQLEVAETEINDAEANIKNIETRQNRGEVTMELYRNRVQEYGRRKEKAETTINGILLRLREETR